MYTLHRKTLGTLVLGGCIFAVPGLASAHQGASAQGESVAQSQTAEAGGAGNGAQVNQEQPKDTVSLNEVVVSTGIVYRKHIDVPEPKISYDKSFFNKFEPISVGDQLRRVPDVSFVGDVGESAKPQMRGLGHGYTQVLVNGRRVPGISNDRAVAVDRIPAAIVDHIEVLRSPTADIDSNGIGGTINVVLKDGATLPPGVIVRVGETYKKKAGLYRPSAAVSWSGRNDANTVFYSLTFQGQKRYNEKYATQGVFDSNSAGFAEEVASGGYGRSLQSWDDISQSRAVERQVQNDSRDSRDLSFNGSLAWNVSKQTTLRFDARVLNTSREEHEYTTVYEGDGSPGGFTSMEHEYETTPIDQHTDGGGVTLYQTLSDTTQLEANISYAGIDAETTKNKFKDTPTNLDEIEGTTVEDTNWYGDIAITQQLPGWADAFGISRVQLMYGVDLGYKNRDFQQTLLAVEDAVTSDGSFNYKQRRADGYGRIDWYINHAVTVTAGVRWENTWGKQQYTNTVGTASGVVTKVSTGGADRHVSMLNPSAHLRWRISNSDTLRFSVARTVRRPSFAQLVPSIATETPEDYDITVGNSNLEMETAIGFDLGYERVLGRKGVFGVNIFTRDISNLLGLVRTNYSVADYGLDPDDYPGNVYTYRNLGDAEVHGIEFDLSTPLGFMGLEHTGLFANYARLFSSRNSPISGEDITINSQPDYIYNVGLTQEIPSWKFSFGAFYNKQGMAHYMTIGEQQTTEYDGNLEFFIEKDFGDNYVLRLTGKNLLDACSYQMEPNFAGDSAVAIMANQAAFNVDAYEVERECASPSWSLTFRAVF